MKRLILVGGGHAHVQVLKDWINAPIPNVELILISLGAKAAYSGMVPGWLAGLYSFEDISIDVAALARRAAARFIADEVTSVDSSKQVLHLRHSDALIYNVLSINIGSTLYPPTGKAGAWLCMRPLGDLHTRWDALLATLAQDEASHRRVIAAGGGPASVESLLAVLARLRQHQPASTFEGVLVSRDNAILRNHAPGAQEALRQVMQLARVSVVLNTDASSFETRDSDIVLWATGAQAHAWPRNSGLAVDAQGFIHINPQLESTSHANVFAVGDCAAWPKPLPKAGVIAVRMGPVLVRNLRAALGDGRPSTYQPQAQHLALLATGTKHAVASWGQWSTQGPWVWRWKDWIDRRFVKRFSVAK